MRHSLLDKFLKRDTEGKMAKKIKGKTLIFDIDGIICQERKTHSRCLAKQNDKAVELINKLYPNNTIILWTARPWDQIEMTVEQLKKFEVRYHTLVMGKPNGDYFIDDRSFNTVEAFCENSGLFDV